MLSFLVLRTYLLASQYVQLSSHARSGQGARSQVEIALHCVHSPAKQQTAALAAAGCQHLSPGSTNRQLTTSTNPGLLNGGEMAGGVISSPGEREVGADCMTPALGM